MTRRGLLATLAALSLRADEAQQVWDLFTELAAVLSAGNAAEFMKPFDRAMPGYGTLEADVRGLLLQAQVQSSIELLNDEGNDSARTVELDWLLRIVEQLDTGAITERRERVRSRLAKQNKKWRILSFDPLTFFTPPRPK